MKNAPIAPLAALLITLGLGFVLGISVSGGTTEVPPAPGSDTETAQRRELPVSARPDGLPRRSDAPTADVSRKETDLAVQSMLASQSTTVPAPERGEGRIDGFVKTADGEPLADVILVVKRRLNGASSNSYAKGRGAPAVPTLEEALQGAASRWRSNRTREFRTTTGSDRSFAFDTLPDGEYSVRAYRNGFEILHEPRKLYHPVGSSVRFIATVVHVVEFDLRLPDGSQPEDAALLVVQGGFRQTGDWSPDRPTRTFVKPLISVLAHSKENGDDPSGFGDNRAMFRSEKITITPSESTGSPVRIDLLARSGIRGAVENAEQLEKPYIRLERLTQGGEPTWNNPLKTAWVRDGVFFFSDLEAGQYAVGIGDPNNPPVDWTRVSVTTGFAECSLTVPAADPSKSVLVRCLTSSGSPLARARLSVVIENNGQLVARENLSQTTDTDGTRLVQLENLGSITAEKLLPPRVVSIVANYEGFPPATATWTPGQREVEIRFPEPCDLTVQVTGIPEELKGKLVIEIKYLGAGVSGMSISSQAPGRSGFMNGNSPAIRSDGTVRFSAARPGPVEITLKEATNTFRARELTSIRAKLRSGPQTIQAPLPGLHPLVVHAPSLPEGTTLSLSPIDRQANPNRNWMTTPQAKVESDQRARFSLLTPGKYELRGGGSQSRITVTVPSGEVLFEARLPDAFRVTIVDEKGFYYRNGLRHQDLVVAIGGVELTGPNMNKVFGGFGLRPSRMTVLRDGQRVQVDLEAFPEGVSPDDLGGQLRPTVR